MAMWSNLALKNEDCSFSLDWEGCASCLQDPVAEYKAGLLRSANHGKELMALCNS